jgi:hypothetical protein
MVVSGLGVRSSAHPFRVLANQRMSPRRVRPHKAGISPFMSEQNDTDGAVVNLKLASITEAGKNARARGAGLTLPDNLRASAS